MASSLTAQLSRIAVNSSNELDLKAQRAAHSQSLIFEKKIAATQDFDTIYHICREGFDELCTLDPRFVPFGRSIFSEQSKSEDRREMTSNQNEDLDGVLEDFLLLVGSRLLLTPAVKSVDWLIRRFRAHEYNTAAVLLTFLPYHTTPLFLNLLSILPSDLTTTFKALHPYRQSLTLPPRQAIIHSASTNKLFFTALNNYVLRVCKSEVHYQALLSFWAGISAEAVSNKLDAARTSRLEIDQRNKQDVLLQVLPVLNDGLSVKRMPDLVLSCYILCIIIANKAGLADSMLDEILEAVTRSWTSDTVLAGINCVSVLAQQKREVTIPGKVIDAFCRLEEFGVDLRQGCFRNSARKLLLGLIAGCLRTTGKHWNLTRLTLVNDILKSELLDSRDTTKSMTNLLSAADELRKSGHLTESIQAELSEMIATYKETNSLSGAFHDAVRESGVGVSALERCLQMVIENGATRLEIEADSTTRVSASAEVNDTFSVGIETLSRVEIKGDSFLEESSSSSFNKLARCFIVAGADPAKLNLFCDLPVLRKHHALDSPAYFSFFIRLFSGPYPPASRAVAVRLLSSYLAESEIGGVDMQYILPYIISCLSDSSEGVRGAAADLLSVFDQTSSTEEEGKGGGYRRWGNDNVYGKERSEQLQALTKREAHKIVRRALLPGLEEYVLDRHQISHAVSAILLRKSDKTISNAKASAPELKKSIRVNFFAFLCSHINHTPLYAVKLRLLKMLVNVRRVSSVLRTQALLPLLHQWRLLSEDAVQRIRFEEQISPEELDHQILAIVSAKDENAFGILLECVTSQEKPPRGHFVLAVFDRLASAWPSLKAECEVTVSDSILRIALGLQPEHKELVNPTKDLLRAVDMSGAVLLNFLNKILESAGVIGSQVPATKRRRISQNGVIASSTKSPEELTSFMQKATFILELIDGSNPENHPRLLPGLFEILAAFHHLKLQIQSEMSYLLSILLGIMWAITKQSKDNPRHGIDPSIIRVNLLVDCICTSESPQLQNTALLLVAGLATIAPEHVLHSVMPIFTFMGSKVLKKDDEYSALVIDQTIDQVIPPLIQSLRKQKRDVVSGASELLVSFTAAFEHIPSHRRLRLFQALISKLGAEDFLFAVLAMLANRYGMDKNVQGMMTSLVSSGEAELQLTTISKYLGLVQDCMQPKPSLSRTLLDVGGEEGREPVEAAADLLQALSYLIKRTSLAAKMAKIFESEEQAPSSNVHSLFSGILEQTLSLLDVVRDVKPVHKGCADVLGTLLNTLTLVDLIDTIEVLLKRQSGDLQRRILRLLEGRLGETNDRSTAAQTRALSFLSTLVIILETSQDPQFKHAAVACIERISDKYGKKDPFKIIETAKVVCSQQCIGLPDDRIRVMGILCLASMTETLGEAAVPIVPESLPRALDLLRYSVQREKVNPQLHDAAYSLISAFAIHVPFMLSGPRLDNLIRASLESAHASLNDLCNENRREALQLVAKRIDIKETFNVIERNWAYAVAQGSQAVREALEVIRIAIEKHPKPSTVKNVQILVRCFYKAFDLRAEQLALGLDRTYDEEEIEAVESLVNDTVIKMVYKVNDTIFRPIFVELTEWATGKPGKKSGATKVARQTTFYKFLVIFFGTLKSIVTGYSSYIIEGAAQVLGSTSLKDEESKRLRLATMHMLRCSFEHDQDDFWQSPSHLKAISTPLVSQLAHATNAATVELVTTEVIPTIVELAVAADSPDNHKEINSEIMKYMRFGTAQGRNGGGDNPRTRLVAVRCEQNLTERLGEEWLTQLPEMLPYISELLEDDDENVEREVRKWVVSIEAVLGEKLDDMLT